MNCSFDSCLNKGRCSKCSPCQLFIVTTATPVSFETEVTLRFDGGRIFFNTEFLKLVVYFHFVTSLGDNYMGIEGDFLLVYPHNLERRFIHLKEFFFLQFLPELIFKRQDRFINFLLPVAHVLTA